MTDEAAFLSTLRANPTDATARGVYADWLDEQARPVDAARMRVLADPGSDARRLEFASACEAAGERERAEFVRVQVELARLPASYDHWREQARNQGSPSLEAILPHVTLSGGSPEVRESLMANLRHFAELERRERELLEVGFLKHLPGTFWRRGSEYGWWMGADRPMSLFAGLASRGFVAAVTCTAADFLQHGDAIREREPIERVKLTSRPHIHGIYQDGMASVRLDGRGDYKKYAQDIIDDAVLLDLLATEFPGIAFELPASPPISGNGGTVTLGGQTLPITGWQVNPNS